MPACTGLPPGLLMRSTTRLRVAVLERRLAAPRRGSRRWLRLPAAISPRTSISAVCGPVGAPPGRAARTGAQATASTSANQARRKKMRQRRSLRRSRSSSRASARRSSTRCAVRSGRRGGSGGRTGAGGQVVQGVSWRAFRTGRRGRIVERRAGCRGKDTNTPAPSRSATSSGISRPPPHGPADAAAVGRLVGRAVDRAEDPAPVQVEELAGLPVHLGGHVGAAVEVGHHPAVEAQREGARRSAAQQHVEHHRPPALRELGAGAQAARPAARPRLQRMGDQPVVQLGVECATRSGAECRRRPRARARRSSPHARPCRRSRASCRSCVVSPIISVRSGVDAELAHQLQQHARVGLARPSRRRCAWRRTCPCSCACASACVQPAPALAGGHRQPVVARLQRLQHLQRAGEQHQLVLAREVVVAVAVRRARGSARAAGRARRAAARRPGPGRSRRPRRASLGTAHADVAARVLDAAHDQRGGVEQRAVPVEDDEVEACAARSGLHAHASWSSSVTHSAGSGASSSTRSPLAGWSNAAAAHAGTCVRSARARRRAPAPC